MTTESQDHPLTADNDSTAMTVHKLGGRRPGSGEPLADLPPEAMEQLRLAHDLRNRLLDLERIYDDAIAAVWARHPEVAEATAAVEAAQTAVDEWVTRAKQQRKVDRTTRPRTETAAQLKEARQVLKSAKQAVREIKQRVYPRANAGIIAAAQIRKANVKALRQEFSERGLYWGTSNDVISHHNVAVARMRSARKKGQPAALKYHRWDGTGTLTIQLQRAAGDPPRTPELLASGEGKWSSQVRLGPYVDPAEWERMSRAQRRHAGRGEARIQVRPVHQGGRVGPEQQITVPIQTHRMLPADADVTLLRLSRRRVAAQHELALSVTAAVAATPIRDEGPSVAVHVGWRVRPDKSLRVATWVASEPMSVPDNLADVLVNHGGGWGEVVVPARWRDSHEHVAGIRAGRDKDLDGIKEHLAGWLDIHGPVDVVPDKPPLTAAMVRNWRSPARIATLAVRWRDQPPPGGEDLVRDLEAWRCQDKHLWTWEANRRKKLEGQRDDAWRRVGAWLGRTARMVIMDDVSIRDLTRVPGVGTEDDAQARASRANAAIAAPSRLRELIRAAASRHGAQLVVESTLDGRHHGCGQRLATRDELAEKMEVWCETCRRPVDQDRNTATMMLATNGQAEPPGQHPPVEPPTQ